MRQAFEQHEESQVFNMAIGGTLEEKDTIVASGLPRFGSRSLPYHRLQGTNEMPFHEHRKLQFRFRLSPTPSHPAAHDTAT